MTNNVHKLALFGNPVHHSLSPKIHQQFASQFDLSIDYQLIEVNDSELADAVELFFTNDAAKGANVTLPHKQNVMTCVKQLSDVAKQAQAVNTLHLKQQQQLCGDNTDGVGFIKDLTKRHGFDFAETSVLILGAGGATQGIVPAIMQQNPNKLIIANRSVTKAQKLCIYENSQAVSFEELNKLDIKFDLIIHASSFGHQGKTLKFLPQHVHGHTIAYDLSYGKPAQAFVEYCKCLMLNEIYDGLGMLVEQAACSFELWFDQKPETEAIYQALNKS